MLSPTCGLRRRALSEYWAAWSACKIIEEVEGYWCKLCSRWHSKGESWEPCTSGVASVQQYWPINSALLLPIFVSSECLSAIAKGRKAHLSQSEGWRGLSGWENKMGVFPLCVVQPQELEILGPVKMGFCIKFSIFKLKHNMNMGVKTLIECVA